MLNTIAASLIAYGYVGLFVASFVAALAVPIPAYIVLAGSGALAAQGHFSIYAVLVVALLGNVSADLLGYLLARHYGKETLGKLGFARVLNSRVYSFMEKYIKNFPEPIVYITRLITEAGPAVNILSGLTKVPFKTFIIYDIAGESSYVLLFALTGYFLGDAWKNNTSFLYKGVAVFVFLGVITGLAQYFMRRHLKKDSTENKVW